MRFLVFLLAVQLLMIPLSTSPVWAQDGEEFIDDTEEGGPPREPPFVDQEMEDENLPTAETPPERPRPQVDVAPTVIEAPPVERSAGFRTPKRPVTPEGQRSGVEKIHHPEAARGLLKIDKEKNYYYKTKEFEVKNVGIMIRGGQVNPAPQITAPNGVTTFESMYTGRPFQGMIDYEWYPFTSMGKLGVQAGLGFYSSTGQGRFEDCDTETDDCKANERYTFYGIPLSAGLVYRLQTGTRPWVAPYIAGGGSYYLLAEKRDDNKPLKYLGTPAFYGSGGLMFNISAFDDVTAFTMESEYGIHNMWISVEYRMVKALNKNLDISANIISMGLVLDY